jgi:hypothetical protein
VFDHRPHRNEVKLDLSRPGDPTEIAYLESFDAQVRRACSSQHDLSSLIDARG